MHCAFVFDKTTCLAVHPPSPPLTPPSFYVSPSSHPPTFHHHTLNIDSTQTHTHPFHISALSNFVFPSSLPPSPTPPPVPPCTVAAREAAEQKRAEAVAAKEAAEAAKAATEVAVKKCQDDLEAVSQEFEELKKQSGVPLGYEWYVAREIQEKKRSLPQRLW